MSKIAFIASDNYLFNQAQSVILSLGLQDKVKMYFARLNGAVKLAERLQNEDVSVIIARGGTAQLIIDSNIKIPVVEVTISAQDLAQIFQEAKLITGLPNPKVAFIGFDNMAPGIETLSAILEINITFYRIESAEEIPNMVAAFTKSSCDILVAGHKTIVLAKKLGLKHIPLRSGKQTVKSALMEAQKIALGRRFEKEIAEKFQVLVNHSIEGIISVDRDQTIQVVNPTAEHLLHHSSKDLIGQRLDQVLHNLPIDSCLAEKQQVIGHIVQRKQSWLTVNIIPIIIGQTVSGAFITFQDITRIQETEAKIRHEVSIRKFTAKYNFDDILGHSPQIAKTKGVAAAIAKVDATVLIIGESGTGKEMFAQSIHNNSPRKNGPFVAINCAALPPNLLESELFGYVDGAFTGAVKKGKPGLFEMAHKGTIFLDEISEMDKYGQSRLLRVLQEREVMRLGDDKYIPIDVRVIAATNKNLNELVKGGAFRQDLFYRLNVLLLNLPMLQKRNGDINYLSEHFVKQYSNRYNKAIELTPKAYDLLEGHTWPGNIRELSHFIERLVIVADDTIISEEVVQVFLEHREYDSIFTLEPSAPIPNISETTQILSALEASNSNITKAAKLLGIARSTLYLKLKEYNIQVKKNY